MEILVDGDFVSIERFDQFGDGYIYKNHDDSSSDLVVAKPSDMLTVRMTSRELEVYFLRMKKDI